MILKNLIKMLNNLDPNSEINNFDICLDGMRLLITDNKVVSKSENIIDTDTKLFKKPDPFDFS
jgi:hypothetical protein